MEAGSPQIGIGWLGAAAEIMAWENTHNSGNNRGDSRLRGLGKYLFSSQSRAREGRAPPEVNLTLSWWNTAVIRLPVAVPWLCQAALTMAVDEGLVRAPALPGRVPCRGAASPGL